MAEKKSTVPATPGEKFHALPPGYSDDAAPRIRAYLAMVRPLRGIADLFSDEQYQSGRSLIERLANSAHGDNLPSLRLSPLQCADVLHFMHYSEPVNPRRWWHEPDDAPSHLVGQMLVLDAMEYGLRSLRRKA